jgi:hypothetical protein
LNPFFNLIILIRKNSLSNPYFSLTTNKLNGIRGRKSNINWPLTYLLAITIGSLITFKPGAGSNSVKNGRIIEMKKIIWKMMSAVYKKEKGYGFWVKYAAIYR